MSFLQHKTYFVKVSKKGEGVENPQKSVHVVMDSNYEIRNFKGQSTKFGRK